VAGGDVDTVADLLVSARDTRFRIMSRGVCLMPASSLLPVPPSALPMPLLLLLLLLLVLVLTPTGIGGTGTVGGGGKGDGDVVAVPPGRTITDDGSL
jgi:hypothetical protein